MATNRIETLDPALIRPGMCACTLWTILRLHNMCTESFMYCRGHSTSIGPSFFAQYELL